MYDEINTNTCMYICSFLSHTMRKPDFLYIHVCKNKGTDQPLFLASWIPQSPFFFGLKFQASCRLLALYRLVYVRPGRYSQNRISHDEAQITLRKHAHMIYSNFFRSKIDNFQRKIFDIFLTFAQNIDCGYTLEPPRRGGSNEYPQSMFWSKNKKNRYTPAYPSFAI